MYIYQANLDLCGNVISQNVFFSPKCWAPSQGFFRFSQRKTIFIDAIFTKSSSYCLIMDLKLLSFGCSFRGFFVQLSCMSHLCTFTVILVGWPLLGKIATVSCLLSLWVTAVPKASKWLCLPFQTDRRQWLCFFLSVSVRCFWRSSSIPVSERL